MGTVTFTLVDYNNPIPGSCAEIALLYRFRFRPTYNFVVLKPWCHVMKFQLYYTYWVCDNEGNTIIEAKLKQKT